LVNKKSAIWKKRSPWSKKTSRELIDHVITRNNLGETRGKQDLVENTPQGTRAGKLV
jgi:hypothetical protein